MAKLKRKFEPQGQPTDDYPSIEEFAVFVDGSLEGGRRSEIVEHLATCASCYDVV